MIRKSLFVAISSIAAVATAGVFDVSFGDYQNSAMTEFAVPIYLSEGEDGFSYGDIAQGGGDLCVSDVTGGSVVTESLPYEIERWDKSGTSVVWVKVPSFSSTTVLRLSWGEDQIAAPNPTALFSDSWAAMHMMDAPVRSEGPIGSAAAISSANQTVSSSFVPTGYEAAFSVSFWFKANSLTSANQYLSLFKPSQGGQFAVLWGFTSGYLELFSNNIAVSGSAPREYSKIPVADLGWHHYAYTYDGTTLRGYCDARQIFEKVITFRLLPGDGTATLTVGGSGATKDILNGCVDEYRMEPQQVSVEELRARCETQSSRYIGARVEVAFPEFSGSTPLTDFPVLVSLDKRLSGFDGPSILAAIEEGTLSVKVKGSSATLPLEREMIVADGENSQFSFWARLPKLDATTKLVVSWLKTGCGERPAVQIPVVNSQVWPTDYSFVWHLNSDATERHDSLGSGGLNFGDKTYAPAMDGPTGRYSAMRMVTGATMAKQTFNGTTGKALGNVYTISFWARKDDFADPKDSYVFFFKPASGQRAILAGYGQGNAFRFYGNGYNDNKTLSIPDDEWHHYAFVSDGTSMSGYRDGECQFSGGKIQDFGAAELSACSVCVGSSEAAKDSFNGGLDEFRVSSVARSPEWIRTSYLNQRVRRHGQMFHNAPGFEGAGDFADTADGVTISSRLNGRQAASVCFLYGSSDAGTDASAWQHSVDLGSFGGTDAVSATLTGMAAGEKVYGRFLAENEYGSAWSPVVCGTAKTDKWSYSAKVTFAGYTGTEALANFPVCIRLPAFARLPQTADAVRIETEDGVQVPYETERWCPAGESVLWARVPELTAATVLYVRWNARSESKTWPDASVWDENYVRVYHFGEDGRDSSVYAAHVENDAISTDADGLAGRARAFAGTGGIMKTAAAPFLEFGEGFTISFCARTTDPTTDQYVYQTKDGQQTAVIFGFTDGKFELFVNENSPSGAVGSQIRSASTVISPDEDWHHYAYSHDGREIIVYRDGVELSRTSLVFVVGGVVPEKTILPLYLGCTYAGTSSFKGALDEWRFEKRARSADWIKASAANMTGTLCTVGGYESKGLCILLK